MFLLCRLSQEVWLPGFIHRPTSPLSAFILSTVPASGIPTTSRISRILKRSNAEIRTLQWPTLSTRRFASRLGMVHKIGNCLSAFPLKVIFSFNKSRTRKNHDMTLKMYQARSDIVKFSFAQRSVPEWMELPSRIWSACWQSKELPRTPEASNALIP